MNYLLLQFLVFSIIPTILILHNSMPVMIRILLNFYTPDHSNINFLLIGINQSLNIYSIFYHHYLFLLKSMGEIMSFYSVSEKKILRFLYISVEILVIKNYIFLTNFIYLEEEQKYSLEKYIS